MQTDERERSSTVGEKPLPIARFAPPSGEGDGRTEMPGKRLIITLLVASALVALLGGLFAAQAARNGGRLHPTAAATATGAAPSATSGATPTPPLPDLGDGWVTVAGLSTSPLPVLAPSDPRVAYVAGVFSGPAKFSAQTLALGHTDDGGATWHPLTLPVKAPSSPDQLSLSLLVSPLDAHHLILSVTTPAGASCPTASGGTGQAQGGGHFLASSGPPCTVQYLSADGGTHWRQITLPVAGVLGIMADSESYSEPAIRGQGARLYALAGPQYGGAGDQTQPTGRLVTSTDGGATWQLADTALPSTVGIADYMPATSGNAVFAVTDRADRFHVPVGALPPPDFKLWRSDDAGAHWALVRSLSVQNVTGIRVVARPGAAQPIVYLSVYLGTASDSALPATTMLFSVDGGHTWAAPPNQGVAQSWYSAGGMWGTLANGSVVAGFQPGHTRGYGRIQLYAWKAGDQSWRPLASELSVMSLTLLDITPVDNSGAQRLWVQASQPSSWATAYYDLTETTSR